MAAQLKFGICVGSTTGGTCKNTREMALALGLAPDGSETQLLGSFRGRRG